MKPLHLFLILSYLPIQLYAFPALLPNITKNLPNITSAWESFNSFAGCQMGDHADGLANLKQYFHRFGYIPDSPTNYTDDFDDILESALKTYQLNFNLNATGNLDKSTLEQIVKPRCGVADIINGTSTMNSGKGTSSQNIHSVAHFTFFPSRPRWPSTAKDLTYAFFPGNQLTDPVKAVFARAFTKWSAVTPLTFRETQFFRSADITIGFFSGDHGDGEPFDGVLGTLAHAFSPTSGMFHLDAAENWVVDDTSTSNLRAPVDLESVAVHEIGHLLGLGHSSIDNAIMFPTISTGIKKTELASDDIEGIQVLYGSNPNGNLNTPSRQARDTSGAKVLSWVRWGQGIVMGLALLLLIGL